MHGMHAWTSPITWPLNSTSTQLRRTTALPCPRACRLKLCISVTQRGLDVQKPNSQNQDPIFTNYSLPEHTPGYPVRIPALRALTKHAHVSAGQYCCCWFCISPPSIY